MQAFDMGYFDRFERIVREVQETDEAYVITKDGVKKAVIISVDEYEDLMQAREALCKSDK